LLGPIDKCAEELVYDRLVDDIPKVQTEQHDFFEPYMAVQPSRARYLLENGKRIQKLLLYNAAIMPTGVLKFCLEYARSSPDGIRGVFESIRRCFGDLCADGLLELLAEVYDFRNTYVAHQEKELKDVEETRKALKKWIELVVWLEGFSKAMRASQ